MLYFLIPTAQVKPWDLFSVCSSLQKLNPSFFSVPCCCHGRRNRNRPSGKNPKTCGLSCSPTTHVQNGPLYVWNWGADSQKERSRCPNGGRHSLRDNRRCRHAGHRCWNGGRRHRMSGGSHRCPSDSHRLRNGNHCLPYRNRLGERRRHHHPTWHLHPQREEVHRAMMHSSMRKSKGYKEITETKSGSLRRIILGVGSLIFY